jgi:hypothetical protein
MSQDDERIAPIPPHFEPKGVHDLKLHDQCPHIVGAFP